MSSTVLTLGIISLLQATFGLLGNFTLLYHNIFLYFTGYRSRSTDSILRHLIVANFMVILAKGIPQAMAAFGWKDFLNDFGCKSLFYAHRVVRGVSFGSTCLLSMFQAIAISPRSSRWVHVKVKSPKYIGLCIFLCWTLHVFVNIICPIFVTSNWDNQTITRRKKHSYCSSFRHDPTEDTLYAVLLAFPDVVCLGLMVFFSGSMVFILHRHKKRVQHIHRNNVSPRSSPETRATQTILMLVGTFLLFYTVSISFHSFVAVSEQPDLWIVNAATLSDASFPTVSAFLLLICDSSAFRLWFARIRKTKSPHMIRNA
ncbi:vomeronasal type-1 receptor 4-like [Tenrec ecaudatus]|uniref:vomeronasal type-1 receptor 4-like n=1 Tax=Tenrec ecaudatus TaxID=94439 RepID=UPI003F5972DD